MYAAFSLHCLPAHEEANHNIIAQTRQLAHHSTKTDDSALVLAQQPPKMGETIGLQEHRCLCRVG